MLGESSQDLCAHALARRIVGRACSRAHGLTRIASLRRPVAWHRSCDFSHRVRFRAAATRDAVGSRGVRASLQAHSLIDYEPIGFRNDRPVYWGTCLVVGMMGLTA